MSIGIHCDGSECDTWTRQEMAEACGFILAQWDGSGLQFCSWDCVLRFAANMPPLEVRQM
jgi:hypothetical protein